MRSSTSACEGDGVRFAGSNCIVGSSLASIGSGVAFFSTSSGICPRAVVGSSSREKLGLAPRAGGGAGGDSATAGGWCEGDEARREMGPDSLVEGIALRPTPSVTRFTSRARRASARRPAARFTGMSAASSSSARAASPVPLFRLLAADRAGVCDPLASSSRASAARIDVSASPVAPSRFGFTSATVPSSPTKTLRGSTSPPVGSACSAISSTR